MVASFTSAYRLHLHKRMKYIHSSFPIDLIIPAYNEGKAIGKVIQDIPKEYIRDIIVCDNNSTDDTAIQAEAEGAKVVFEPMQGYGRACLAGIKYIQQQPSDQWPAVVVFMDGDYSDYPEEIPALIAPLLGDIDLVIGSRVTGKADPGSLTVPQRFGNWLATRLIKLFWGHSFTDLGPFRAIRWHKLLQLDMQDKTYGWTVEMQVKALKRKLSCTEVPVSYRKRIGKSKISGTVKGSIMAGYKILWTIIKSV